MAIFVLNISAQANVGKTLVIGDSLLEAGLGKRLAQATSQGGGESCVLSVSGSSFKDWTDKQLRNKNGANIRHFVNGRTVSWEEKTLTEEDLDGLNVFTILKNPQKLSCGSQPFTSIVVELGANSPATDDPVPYMQKIIDQAIGNHINPKNVRFILPPGKKTYANIAPKIRKSYMKNYGPEMYYDVNERAAKFLTKAKLPEPYDTSRKLRIPDKEFSDGVEHFYGSPSEKTWANNLAIWLNSP